MSPILGIWASQNYPRVTTSFESIATVSVGSGTANTVEFTSIPSSFDHLQIRALVQTNRATFYIGDMSLQFNNDTGSNYASHLILGDGASVSADAYTTQSNIAIGSGSTGTTTGGTFAGLILDILDYKNTNKYKTTRALVGEDHNGTGGGNNLGGRIQFTSGLWQSTSAITSLKFTAGSGTNFSNYTHFALYGIKGA